MRSDREVRTGHWTNWVDYWVVDFRTRRDHDWSRPPPNTYDRRGRYTVAVKVVDIFGHHDVGAGQRGLIGAREAA